MKFRLSGLFLLLFTLAPGTWAAPGVGDPAPAFSLPGSDGRTWTLEEFRGAKAVVIAFFPKAFTGG